MKKGISLPIEMIVIIAIAVLVLVVIAAMFIGGVKLNTADQAAYGSLCLAMMSDCTKDPSAVSITGVFDVNQDGKIDTTDVARLDVICGKKGLDTSACRRACGCPA